MIDAEIVPRSGYLGGDRQYFVIIPRCYHRNYVLPFVVQDVQSFKLVKEPKLQCPRSGRNRENGLGHMVQW